MLTIYIEQFWQEVFGNKEDHLLLLCRVKFNELEYRTLGHLIKVNYEDKELFTNYLSERLTILDESYIHNPICQISFSYIIKSGKCLDAERTLITMDNKKVTVHNFNNMNLPISMNPHDYGRVIVSNIITEGITFERFIVVNKDKTYQIDVMEGGIVNRVTILGVIKLSWIDTLLSEEQDLFQREIKKSTIYFMDGEIILRKKEIPAKPFSPLFKESLKNKESLNNKYITMDIESIRVDKKVKPYLINSYDGRHYLTSYNHNERELFREFFTKLINQIQESSPNKIYAHNLSTLSIKLFVVLEGIKTTIIFKDSYLLLPSPLRNLCSAFNIEASKGYFPFNLDNLNYSGVFPKLEYWVTESQNITNKEWNHLKIDFGRRMWNFKLESIKYCELDCVTLHQVITQFNELIYDKFNINIHDVLTISSLAMRIYKTHYMPKDTIYQLGGRLEFDIRKSYTGGAVDVYIPHNRTSPFIGFRPLHKLLYSYDVNGLYPFVMAKW